VLPGGFRESGEALLIAGTVWTRNPKTQKKRFYNPNIMKEFDEHYAVAKPRLE
jgi:hypothetical protein